MINEEKYYCVSVLGAEILMVITSLIIIISIMLFPISKINRSDQNANLLLSSACTIFLPLMSYLFSQAKQYNSYGRAQVILIWMVLIEIIRIYADPIFTWRLKKSAEQLVRLFWVGYLICSYAPLHGIRVSLLVLCIYFGFYEILNGIMFNIAKDSYLMNKNPKIIHKHVERIYLEDILHTTPMNICDYIVMGEENYEIEICGDGYVLGKKKSYEGIITVGRVFQLNSSEDEAFTSVHPNWRGICLSHALAKMLRRRFGKLPIEEAGCRKSLDFVLEGMISYIGTNGDIQTDGNHGERNPTSRIFSIIQEELEYVSDFLNIRISTSHYFKEYTMVGVIGTFCMLGNGIYLIYTINKSSSAWLSLVVEKTYNHCLFNGFRHGSMVVKVFSRLDLAITILLFLACIFIQYIGSRPSRWSHLEHVDSYFKDPTKWKLDSPMVRLRSKINKLLFHLEILRKLVIKTRVYNYSSIFDLEAETIFFCIKVDVSILARLPKWIRRLIPISSPTVICSTDAKEAILMSLRRNFGRLTNGETSLRHYGMGHFGWACSPHIYTTEIILVWHIATTLFHNRHEPSDHQNNDPHQEPESQQKNNPFKEQEVALALSSYCHYLVKYLPDLLPDNVEWTEELYERVRKEILDIDQSSDEKPTKINRCKYALLHRWTESSVVGKGVRLAKDLMHCAEDGHHQVWWMLAEFWAEMMLFIAPSDNVDGHEKLLDRDELITQLRALLTHAGIITRPKPTEHQS